jgi:Putative zinc-finger
VVGYEGSRNVSQFAAKTIAQKSATFLTLANLIEIRFVDPQVSRRGRKRFNMEISCREVRQELANYMEDDITSELRLRIERHFLRCDGCSALYDGLRQIIYLVNESDLIELPAGLSRRLFQRLNTKSAD